MHRGALLTDRDIKLLERLYRLRGLTTEQVVRLGFPSNQTALRRLRRLEGAGLVRCSVVPTMPTRFVTLTPRGMEAVREAGPEHACAPRRLPSPLFLRHLAVVNDLWLALDESLRGHADVELLNFASDRDRLAPKCGGQPRPILSFDAAGAGGAPMRHTADAAFVLRRGSKAATFIAEVDLGTEVVGDPGRGVGKAVLFYLHSLACGELRGLASALPDTQQTQGFRVLLLTTSDRRIEGIRRRWGTQSLQPEEAKRFIWLGTLAALRGNELLGWPWVSLDPHDVTRYVILPKRGE